MNCYTGIDVIGNQVEIGIDPYNEATIQLVHDTFGKKMIHVVPGLQAETMGAMEDEFVTTEDGTTTNDHEDLNLLQRLLQVVSDWISHLFGK